MVVKAELEAAETAASAAKKAAAAAEKKLAKLESDLKSAQTQAEKLEKKATTAEADLAKAKKATSALEREVSQVKASFKTADSEALQLRQRVEEAEKKLREIHEHHTAAWLPHWLEETAGKGLGAAGGVLKNATGAASTTAIRGSDIAITVLRTKVLPMTLRYIWKAKTGGFTLAVFVGKRLAEKNIVIPPAVKKVVGEAYEKAKSSEIGAKAQEYTVVIKENVAKQFAVVVAELESLLVQAAGVHPSLAPLAQKPTSTFVVYFVLFAPLLAIGMPLLASSRSKSSKKSKGAAAASSSSTRKQAASASKGGATSKKTPSSKKR
jgi:predicted RNase H-like nuclease (RuvC/YqgF family)